MAYDRTAYRWRGRRWFIEILRFEYDPQGYGWDLYIRRDGDTQRLREYEYAADAALAVMNRETGDLRWDGRSDSESPPDDLDRWDD